MSDAQYLAPSQVYRKWAKERCDAWNWNCNVAEIAKELIESGVTDTTSTRFDITGKVFVEYFGDSNQAEMLWEIIGHIIEEFS